MHLLSLRKSRSCYAKLAFSVHKNSLWFSPHSLRIKVTVSSASLSGVSTCSFISVVIKCVVHSPFKLTGTTHCCLHTVFVLSVLLFWRRRHVILAPEEVWEESVFLFSQSQLPAKFCKSEVWYLEDYTQGMHVMERHTHRNLHLQSLHAKETIFHQPKGKQNLTAQIPPLNTHTHSLSCPFHPGCCHKTTDGICIRFSHRPFPKWRIL